MKKVLGGGLLTVTAEVVVENLSERAIQPLYQMFLTVDEDSLVVGNGLVRSGAIELAAGNGGRQRSAQIDRHQNILPVQLFQILPIVHAEDSPLLVVSHLKRHAPITLPGDLEVADEGEVGVVGERVAQSFKEVDLMLPIVPPHIIFLPSSHHQLIVEGLFGGGPDVGLEHHEPRAFLPEVPQHQFELHLEHLDHSSRVYSPKHLPCSDVFHVAPGPVVLFRLGVEFVVAGKKADPSPGTGVTNE